MKPLIRKSRVAFAIIKLRVADVPYFLLRLNPKWKDVNFIGGHEKPRDGGDLERTVRRELWEEVPPIRDEKFSVEALTDEFHYGPVYSRSRAREVEYDLRFFLIKLGRSPEDFVEGFSPRTRNTWIARDDLLGQRKFRVSMLVKLLNEVLPGGLSAIAYSSDVDLHRIRKRFERPGLTRQLELTLK